MSSLPLPPRAAPALPGAPKFHEEQTLSMSKVSQEENGSRYPTPRVPDTCANMPCAEHTQAHGTLVQNIHMCPCGRPMRARTRTHMHTRSLHLILFQNIFKAPVA